MRGNLDTRLRKLERGDCEALVLAAAGVNRLGLTERITGYFSLDQMCPAVGQGALGIEIRAGDPLAREAVVPLDQLATHQAVRAERAVLRRLGGGCQVPIAAHAVVEGDHLKLRGLVADLEGTQVIRAQATGPVSDPEVLVAAIAEDLLRQARGELRRDRKILGAFAGCPSSVVRGPLHPRIENRGEFGPSIFAVRWLLIQKITCN